MRLTLGCWLLTRGKFDVCLQRGRTHWYWHVRDATKVPAEVPANGWGMARSRGTARRAALRWIHKQRRKQRVDKKVRREIEQIRRDRAWLAKVNAELRRQLTGGAA